MSTIIFMLANRASRLAGFPFAQASLQNFAHLCGFIGCFSSKFTSVMSTVLVSRGRL
jgi:hypothetical protein